MKSKIVSTSEPLRPRELDRAERVLGRKIPRPYREFLQRHNGGQPETPDFKMTNGDQLAAVKSFLGVDLPEETLNLEYVLSTFRDQVPARFFPFARDPGGNLMCIAENGPDAGKIYFWDHERETDNMTVVADTFDEFLGKLGKV